MGNNEIRIAILDYPTILNSRYIRDQEQILDELIGLNGRIREAKEVLQKQAKILCSMIERYKLQDPSAAKAIELELSTLEKKCAEYVA